MASFKTNPIYCSLLGILGLAVVAAGWGIYDRHAATQKSAHLLAEKRRELNALQAVQPVPSEASKAAVEADLRRTEVALATMRDELKGRGPIAERMRNAVPPAEPTEMFFNLETFVEKTRQSFKKPKTPDAPESVDIKIKPDERFGFYTYVQTGPDRDLIPQVFRQRLVIEYLLDALIEAQPSELLSVHRERPLSKAELAAIAAGQPPVAKPASSSSAQANSDFFEIDPRISARVPGFIGATAFRVTFISESASLRSLLNKLATFELPLVVRGVEVEPLPKTASAAAGPAPGANSLSSIFGTPPPADKANAEPPKPKPIVEKVLSKFTVTVELIDLISSPSTAASTTP